MDPVMNFKSRNPGALMVKGTCQSVCSFFHDVCFHYRSAILLFTSLYVSATQVQTLLLLTHSAPGKETTFSFDVRKRNGFDPRTAQPVAHSLYLLSYPAHTGTGRRQSLTLLKPLRFRFVGGIDI